MNDDDKTPVDGRSTIEMIADDMRATKLAVQNTETTQLRMYEEFKGLREEVQDYRRRSWTPALVAAVAALVSMACAVSAAIR